MHVYNPRIGQWLRRPVHRGTIISGLSWANPQLDHAHSCGGKGTQTIQRQSVPDAPQYDGEDQTDEAKGERSNNMPSASTGCGYRKHSVSTQTRIRYRDLAGRNTQERPGGEFYLRIVRPLSHREPRPDSVIICKMNIVRAAGKLPA